MFVTLNTAVSRVISALGQVPGLGTQTYSEDAIVELLQQVFDINSQKFWVPQQMKWFSKALDGVTGLPVSDFTNIARYEDIRAIFFGTGQRPLPRLPADFNPFTMTGSTALYQEPTVVGDTEPSATSNRLFRVWPLASAGTVYVHARQRSSTLFNDGNNVIYFDDIALINGAAWMYTTDDGANPAGMGKFKEIYEERITSMQDAYNKQPIILDPRVPMGTNGWTEWPPT